MTLQQLEYILAVARHGHFGRAADACNVTQPTLSAMIGKLEEEIGAKLFDRNRQPIVPTIVGERVINRAREVLDQADTIKDIVLEESNRWVVCFVSVFSLLSLLICCLGFSHK